MEVANELHKQGIPFVVIENKVDKLELLRTDTPYLFVEGDATHEDVLEEAGIRKASSVIVTLPSDADNLFVTLTVRQLHATVRIISRASNEADEKKIHRAGANQTVVPERIGGYYMANWVNNPDMLSFYNLLSVIGAGNLLIEEIDLHDLNDAYLGVGLGSSLLKSTTRVSIVAARQPDGRYELNPGDDLILRKGCKLVVLGSNEQIQHFKRLTLSSL
jgi:voltage-gated potassium channel